MKKYWSFFKKFCDALWLAVVLALTVLAWREDHVVYAVSLATLFVLFMALELTFRWLNHRLLELTHERILRKLTEEALSQAIKLSEDMRKEQINGVTVTGTVNT
jgi:hypothetical protein